MKTARVEEKVQGKQITLVLPKALIEETRELAEHTGVARNRIVAQALDHYLALHRAASCPEGEQVVDEK